MKPDNQQSGKGILMRKKMVGLAAALLGAAIMLSLSCGKDKTVTEYVQIDPWDIYGVAEYEADGDYPPPFSLDNLSDENIVVTLYFGQQMDFYQENDVYGYFISYDDNSETSNEENFNFPFVPAGKFWLDAEFTILDSCFYAKTTKFTHSDSAHTFREIRPVFLGIGRDCWSVDVAGASDMVQINKNCWVTREVYQSYYKDKMENGELIEP